MSVKRSAVNKTATAFSNDLCLSSKVKTSWNNGLYQTYQQWCTWLQYYPAYQVKPRNAEAEHFHKQQNYNYNVQPVALD